MSRNDEWEGAVEERIKKLEAQIKDRDLKLAESHAQVNSLKAAVEAHQVAAEQRAVAEREAYMGDLQKQATLAGCPLEAEQIKLVQDAFDRKDDATARQLGAVFLKSAQAMGAARPVRGIVQSLSPSASAGVGSPESISTARSELFAAAGIKE